MKMMMEEDSFIKQRDFCVCWKLFQFRNQVSFTINNAKAFR